MNRQVLLILSLRKMFSGNFKEPQAGAGKTVIIVTHNPEVADYADVVIKMKDGEVVETIEK